jgi:hypothetical protein
VYDIKLRVILVLVIIKIFEDQIHKEIKNIYLQFQANFSTQDGIGWCPMRYLHASSMLNRGASLERAICLEFLYNRKKTMTFSAMLPKFNMTPLFS